MNGVIAASGRYGSQVVSFSVGGQETAPKDIFFKPDGTKMYIVGWTNDSVFQYTLSTAWNISTATYDSIIFSASAQISFASALFFDPLGVKLYLVEATSDIVFQYTLSTAWNVSTATYDSVSLDVTTEQGAPAAIYFKPDGLKMFVSGGSPNMVFQYTLSTAWNISTATYDNVSIDLQSNPNSNTGLYFKLDGLSFYVVGITNIVYKYNLTVAWDISTATYSGDSLTVSNQETSTEDVFLKPDGFKIYVIGSQSDSVHEYSLTPAWDL